MKKQKCFYCDAAAEYLCDRPLKTDGLFNGESCNRPLCESHRHQQCIAFFCGSAKWAGVDSVDYCPAHHFNQEDDPPGGPKGGSPIRMKAA